MNEKNEKTTAQLEHPLTSVVMLAWNRMDDVRESLKHVFESTYPNLEVIVVDNASTDGTAEMIEKEFPRIRLIRLPRNMGIEGFNVGFANAKGRYVVILDDDSYPFKESITRAVNKLETSPGIGALACRVMMKSEERDRQDTWGFVDSRGKFAPDKVEYGTKAIAFIGCGTVLRRNVLLECGYYPKEFFLYANEVDVSFKMMVKGYKIHYCPDCIFYHKWSPVQRSSPFRMFYARRNVLLLASKLLPARKRLKVYSAIFFFLLLKTLAFKDVGLNIKTITTFYGQRKSYLRDTVVVSKKERKDIGETFYPYFRYFLSTMYSENFKKYLEKSKGLFTGR